jgi:hypothetical protein
MNRHEFMRIYNSFDVFLESLVSPTAVGEEKGRAGGMILGCVEGGSGEPGRDSVRRCWGKTYLIRIIIDIFSTIFIHKFILQKKFKNC